MDRLYEPVEMDCLNENVNLSSVYVQRSKYTQSRQARSDERVIKLQAMDRHKNQFLATLAHELRTPLAPIKCALDTMAMMHLDDEVESLRLMMNRQIGQMAFLINDLLDISRVSCGKLAIRREASELRSIIAGAVEASMTFISESGQTLTVSEIAEHDCVFADAPRLMQVVSNLLNNASKYSGSNCHIDLNVTAVDEWVTIQVRDNGIGIAADQLDGIFDLFAQVNGQAERGAVGLGIGLSLVKTIVELHGGAVRADSAGLGCGSVFTAQLPVAMPPQKVPPLERQRSPQAASRAFRVLVIEDHRALRLVMVSLLEKLGHTVEVAENALAALAKLENFQPEVIFSDITMPGMNGLKLAQLLRERSDMSEVFMVAVTGSGTVSDRELADAAGFDEHMTKPVEMQRLQTLFTQHSQPRKSFANKLPVLSYPF